MAGNRRHPGPPRNGGGATGLQPSRVPFVVDAPDPGLAPAISTDADSPEAEDSEMPRPKWQTPVTYNASNSASSAGSAGPASTINTPRARAAAPTRTASDPNKAAKTSVKTTPVARSDSVRNAPPAPKAWTVSKLTRHVRMALETQFRNVLLEGEISNFKRSAQGHLYFSLKDDAAQIRGVMFRNAARALKFEPDDGLEVTVRGQISVYEARGDYQLNITSMEPKGVGALQLAFDQMRAKLEKEGLFEASRKQQIPFMPRRIGVITSQTGAVIHDMINVLTRRMPGIPVVLHPSAVQGDIAPLGLITAMRYLNSVAHEQEIDVIIIGRGGGSMEDLWAFNDEELAREIAASAVPVISAVGHETDFTICDFVADLRAPTPSAAMELAVPNREDLLTKVGSLDSRLRLIQDQRLSNLRERLNSLSSRLQSPDYVIRQHIQKVEGLSDRLQMMLDNRVGVTRQRLDSLSQKLTIMDPRKELAGRKREIDQYADRLQHGMQNLIARRKDQLASKMELLDAKSPLTIMRRGYAAVLKPDGKLVRSASELETDETVQIQFEDGRMSAKIIESLGNPMAKPTTGPEKS